MEPTKFQQLSYKMRTTHLEDMFFVVLFILNLDHDTFCSNT